MYATDANQVIWPGDLWGSASIPAAAKEFLTTTGLPPFVSDLSVEFGVFASSEPGPCVIGTDGDNPIVVDENGAVRLLIEETTSSALFVNSSVQTLSQFLHQIAMLTAGRFEDVSTFRSALSELRHRLRVIDAMEEDGSKVWPPLLEDMDAMAS